MKQIIIVRKDLEMPAGKMAAQCCHGCLGVYKKINKEIKSKWEKQGEKKVVVYVESLDELISIREKCQKKGLKSYMVKDAGKTVLKPGTITVLAIGPDKDEKIDEITSSLPLLD